MNTKNGLIVINNIKLPIDASHKEAFSVAKKRLSRIGLPSEGYTFRIYKRSVDARDRNNLFFVYSVSASGHIPSEDALVGVRDISLVTDLREPEVLLGFEELSAPPCVVGSGPAGLFAALILAENGYAPVIIERGGSVSERRAAVERFNTLQILDPETNIQFGAGGAGTFSDGKLVTRVNDPLTNYVLDRFVDFGASEEIKYAAKPHVGTDVLSLIVDRMIDRITELGGKIHYHTKFLSAISKDGRVCAVETSRGQMPAGALILAVGHSARDTYETLIRSGYQIEAKNFSVGMRIEHLCRDIDAAMYGKFAGHEKLGHAEYTLSNDTKNRGVYTFCMCPGGEVVAAASEEGGVVVNGMSYNSRSGQNSNSAVVSTVFKEDYGSSPMAAIEFQREIECRAYRSSGGNYSAPLITLGDFFDGRSVTEPKRILPTYMGGKNYSIVSPDKYLPSFAVSGIKNALMAFDKRIHGFACRDAVLTGAETRTSAPVRILRDNETRLAYGYKNLYPAGEGAGYAGGITSASIDGIKTALSLMKIYKPFG